MRALVQRVAKASVTVAEETVGEIGVGLAILLGVAKGDNEIDASYLVDKISNLRVFPDSESNFNLSALDIHADILVVSQFTLYADTRKGRRPDFNQAASAEEAKDLYEHTTQLFRDAGLTVATGQFQQHMQVTLQNDGPVTLILDSNDRKKPRRG